MKFTENCTEKDMKCTIIKSTPKKYTCFLTEHVG